MQFNNKTTGIRIISVALLLAYIAFAIYNLVWIANIYLPFRALRYQISDEKTRLSVLTEEKNLGTYSFYVGSVDYPYFFGNQVEIGYNDTEIDVTAPAEEMLIYKMPYKKETKIYLYFRYPNAERENKGEPPSIYVVRLDSNGNCIKNPDNPEAYDLAQSLKAQNQNQSFKLFDYVREQFTFDSKDLFKIGIKACFSDSVAETLIVLLLIFGSPILMLWAFIWVFTVFVPFRELCGDMQVFRDTRDFRLKRNINNYCLAAIDPRFLRKDSALAVFRQPAQEDTLYLLIKKKKDGWHYYAVKRTDNKKLRQSEQIEFMYYDKKIFCSDPEIKERQDELIDLYHQAHLFWQIS